MSAKNAEIVRAAIAAFNDHDVPSYMTYHSADVTYLEPFSSEPIVAADVPRFFQSFLDQCPDAHLHTSTLVVDGSIVAVENELSGTLPTRDPSNRRRPFRIREAVFFELDSEKIKVVRVYLDRKAMETQIGAEHPEF